MCFFQKKENGYPPIRNIPVLYFWHLPFVASLPFFILVLVGFFIVLFALHFTQYPVTIKKQDQFNVIRKKILV